MSKKIQPLLDALDEFRNNLDHELNIMQGYKRWNVYCDRCGSMVKLCPIVQEIIREEKD